MKRKIVEIKSDPKAGGVWCHVNGDIVELLTSHFALTQNLIEALIVDEEGQKALKELLTETIKEFEKNGIVVSNNKENENEGSNNN